MFYSSNYESMRCQVNANSRINCPSKQKKVGIQLPVIATRRGSLMNLGPGLKQGAVVLKRGAQFCPSGGYLTMPGGLFIFMSWERVLLTSSG